MLPALQRELRVHARRPATGWLRLGCGFSMAVGLAVAMTVQVTTWTPVGPVTQGLQGAQIFQSLAQLLAAVILLVGPLVTADCLSEERREGTLPLLWLTPLTARGVVLAKLSAGSLQLVTLVLASAPVLTVPILMGGVSPAQLLATGSVLVILMLLGVGCGVWASAGSLRFQRALVLAYAVEFMGLWLLVESVMIGWPNALGSQMPSEPWLARFAMVFAELTTPDSAMRGGIVRGGVGAAVLANWVPVQFAVAILLGLTLIGFAGMIVFTGRRLQGFIHERPLTLGELAQRRRWMEPRFFPGMFRRLRLRLLARNPLRWLQRRTPAQAVARWLWLGAIAVLWISTMAGYDWVGDGSFDAVWIPFALLGIGLLVTATGALREESRNGVLELLLVTGLRENQILRSVLWGAIDTFGLAIVLHGTVATYLGSVSNSGSPNSHGFVWILLGALLLAPMIALGFSLRGYPFLLTVAATGGLSLLVPWLLSEGGIRVLSGAWPPLNDWKVPFGAGGIQLLAAWLLWHRRRLELVSRRFVTRRAANPG